MSDQKTQGFKGILEGLVSRLEKVFEVSAVVGPLGYIVWALAQDDESRDAFLEAKRLGHNLYRLARSTYNKLRGGLMAVVAIIFASNAWILYQSYHMTSLYRPGPFWHSFTHSRGIVLGMAELILVGLVIDFCAQVLPVTLGLDFVHRQLSTKSDAGPLEKLLRSVGKYHAWMALSVTLLIGAPFWHDPSLLLWGGSAVLIYPFFCNAWKAGTSEHLRRILLWLTAQFQADAILLVTFPQLETWLKTINSPQPSPMAFVILSFFVLQFALAIFMGSRKTSEDLGRESVLPYIAASEAAEGHDLDRLDRLAKYVDQGKSNRTPRTVSGSSSGNSISAQPMPSGGPLVKPTPPPHRAKTFFKGGFYVLLFLLAFWLVWRNLIDRQEWTHKVTPTYANMMIRNNQKLPAWLRYPGKIVGDGAVQSSQAPKVIAISQNRYTVELPADLGWQSTGISVRPGDIVTVTIQQPFYMYGHRRESVAGVLWHGPIAGIFVWGPDRLFTPYDDYHRAQLKPYYLRADQPIGGLELRLGTEGFPNFCGRGGQITCPGRFDYPPKPREIFLGINLPQDRAVAQSISGKIILEIEIVPYSKHPT